jgi:hypothetical protein
MSSNAGWKGWSGDQVARAIRSAGGLGLADAADQLLDLSKEVVPVDQEDLIMSGATDVDPAAMEAVVSYDTPYAVRQHEDTALNHPKADLGQGAKYLEKPLADNQQALLETIRDTLDSQTGLKWTVK